MWLPCVQQISDELLMVMNEKTNKPLSGRQRSLPPTEDARLRVVAPIHDWTRSACQELSTMLAGLGEAPARAHACVRPPFRFTFEERTSSTPVD